MIPDLKAGEQTGKLPVQLDGDVHYLSESAIIDPFLAFMRPLHRSPYTVNYDIN